jgi:hypothetical protein
MNRHPPNITVRYINGHPHRYSPAQRQEALTIAWLLQRGDLVVCTQPQAWP